MRRVLLALTLIVFLGCDDTTDETPQADTAQPPADTAQPPEDTAQPPEDTAQPPEDTAQPPEDTGEEDTQVPVDTAEGPKWGIGLGTFVNVIRLDETNPPADGFDYNNDGQPDNFLGPMLAQLAVLVGIEDINQDLADNIATGEILLLAESQDYEGGADDPDVQVYLFFATDPQSMPDNMLMIHPGSFDEAGEPMMKFDTASVAAGKLSASAAQTVIAFKWEENYAIVQLHDAKLKGDVSKDDNGVALANGVLAGLIPKSSAKDLAQVVVGDAGSAIVDSLQPDAITGGGEPAFSITVAVEGIGIQLATEWACTSTADCPPWETWACDETGFCAWTP